MSYFFRNLWCHISDYTGFIFMGVVFLSMSASQLCAQEHTAFDLTTPQGILNFAKTGQELPPGADINVFDDKLRNALHLAIIEGYGTLTDMEVVKIAFWLIKRGVLKNFTDYMDKSPLHYAAYYGNLPAVILLVEHGSHINTGDTSDILDRLRHFRATNKNQRFFADGTALHEAILSNKPDIIAYLLKKGARISATDAQKATPLHRAAYLGNTDIVQLLIKADAPVDALEKHERTVMHYAVNSRKPTLKLLDILVQAGVAIDQPDLYGKTPLMFSAKHGFTDITHYLIRQDANIFAVATNQRSLLHFATFTRTSQLDLVRFLIEQGLDVNAQDQNGSTPLHHATLFGNVDIVIELLTHKASLEVTNHYDETPLLTSVAHGYKAVDTTARILIDAGANIHKKLLNPRYPDLNTPLGIRDYAYWRRNQYPKLYDYIESLFDVNPH